MGIGPGRCSARGLFAALGAALLLSLATAPAARAVVPGTVLAESTFDTDADGWSGGNALLTYQPGGGNPGGHIISTPLAPSHPPVLLAANKFLGDKSAALGGALSFHYLPSSQTADADNLEVELHAAPLRLQADLSVALTAGVWSANSIALVRTSFQCVTGCSDVPTQAQFDTAVGALELIVIRSAANAGADGLDNVSLTAGPNDPPSAAANLYAAHEDTALSIPAPTGVLANDSDADDDPLSVVSNSTPAHGSVTLNVNGSFVYTPDPDVSGVDSFTYSVSDGTAEASATVTIAVSPDGPIAADDAYTMPEDALLVIAAPGVLNNDTHADNTPLTAVSLSTPAHGAVALNANGSFAYKPAANFNGVDSFTYAASDGTSQETATVTINVTPVPEPRPRGPLPLPLCAGKTATIVPAPGQTVVTGTPGADVIVGRDAGETINGGGGNDTICANRGNDKVRGGSGDDVMLGEEDNDRLLGDGGDDLLLGGTADDDVRGGSGRDRMAGGEGRDRVDGGSGNDLLDEQALGGNGNDRLYGGSGRDRVRTAGGAGDRVDCGRDRDSAVVDARDRHRRCERVRFP